MEHNIQKDTATVAEPLNGGSQDLVSEAKAGNSQSQRALGHELLAQANLTPGDAAQGIHWLCQASLQGDEEATNQLKVALEKEQVTEENLEEVKWCVNTPPLEKSARAAAKRLFLAVNPLSPDTELLKTLSTTEQKLIEKTLKKQSSIDEATFVEKIMKRFHGSSRSTIDALLQNNVEMEAFNSASWLSKVFRYPGKLLSEIATKSIDAIGQQGMAWVKKLIPVNQIYTVIAFFIYSLITLDMLMFLIPLVIFYITFIAMSVTTLQMFYTKRKQKDVNTVASLLARFNDSLDHDTAVSAYAWESLQPYIVFFLCLIINVSVFAMADNTWIPCSELTCLSAFFFASCFYALNDADDDLLQGAVCLDVISKLPQFLVALPNIPYVTPCLVLLTDAIYSFNITNDVQCNISIPATAKLAIPLLFIAKVIHRKLWRGWHRFVIPLLVCFFWWQLAVLFAHFSTWPGLLRASIGWLTLVMMLPVAVLGFTAYVLDYAVRAMTVASFLKLVVTVVLLSIPIVIGMWSRAGIKLSWLSLKERGIIRKIGFVAVFVAMFAALFVVQTPMEQSFGGKSITWPEYNRFCGKPRWDQSNIASAQQICSHLKHAHVEWQGKVKKVVVKETSNKAEDFLAYVPLWLSEPIRCAYGKPYSNCDGDSAICDMLESFSITKCHLKNLDIHLFEIWVEMTVQDNDNTPVTQDIRIRASNWFKESLQNLSEGDSITFRAAFHDGVGNIWPELNLFYLQCVEKGINFGSKAFISETSWRVVDTVRNGTIAAWNFLLSPFLQIG